MKLKFSEKHINEFKKMGILAVYLFGSRATGQYIHDLSDFDFGVVFEKPERYEHKTMKPYLKLYDIFIGILPQNYLKRRFKLRKHEFDIVLLQYVPSIHQIWKLKKKIMKLLFLK